jgi:hypothetical protein
MFLNSSNTVVLMINRKDLPADLRSLYARQVAAAGSVTRAEARLIEIGLRAVQAAVALSADASPPAVTVAPRGVDILRDVLAGEDIVIGTVHEGRPTIIQITAKERLIIGEADETGVGVHTTPVVAAVYTATKRSSGSALFFISSFLSNPREKTGTHPPLMFLVLLEERRVWAVTREDLRSIHRALKAKRKVTNFVQTPGGLRISLPRRASGFDVPYRIMRDPTNLLPG